MITSRSQHQIQMSPLQLQEGCDHGKENNQTPKLDGIKINGIVEETSVRTWDKNLRN